MSQIPADLLYTQDHEWVRIEGGVGTIGITDYAQHALGDVVFVDVPRKGDPVTAGKALGSVESVKAVSEIFAPVSGEIVEVNGALDPAPDTLNKDPYGGGWICKIRMSNPSETEKLLRPDAYGKLVEESA